MNILITTLNSKFIHTSLSIRYLKSYSESEFPNIDIEEYTINQSVDYITGEIFKKECDIVAFSCYIWNIESTLEICERLKIVNPDIKIILGGPEVSFDSEDIMKRYEFVDFVIDGEGEETFKELLVCIRDRKDLNKVEGIVFRDGQDIIRTPLRPLIQNLDDIPSPFEGDLSEYNNKIVYFESSRGCPFNCKFCLSSTIKGVRYFSIDRVKSDLKKLIDAEVKQVKFVDRTFNARKEYAMEVMNFIISEGVSNTNFHFEVTADLLDEDIIEFLKNIKEGLFQFEIGVQSTNPRTLDIIDRKTDFKRLSEVVTEIKSFKNIHLHLDLIAGLPYEGYDSFKKSFNDVYALNPDKLQLGFLKLLKGSQLRIDGEKYGFKFIDKPPYEILETEYMSYGEMLKLKTIEDLVEKYGNEGYFSNTIRYIINNFYESPFDFYENFAEYWEVKEHHKVSHNRTSLYKKLYEYYKEVINEDNGLFVDVLKLDFLMNSGKSPTLPSFMKKDDTDYLKTAKHEFLKDEKNIESYLCEFRNTPVKKIINQIHIEEFNFDVLDLIEKSYDKNFIIKGNKVLLFKYNNEDKIAINKCKVFNITDNFKN
ncbi:Fe-S oxidoreductase [Gottschalkia purinilytica]|uniref:Fe-S oxidoreductase n=1 Tax=Gottschalkia purinilytica TaxID=1503 RepID=A0A0L0W8B4_GOTPU|nr:B12-binding domain-containing radical SAM protein [Gottschalkia purinilytica]KNF07505.1 Fe-S oxidoreductase [Gottschalkia purinilytica]